MKFASLAALSVSAVAHGEIVWNLSDSMVLWSGGFAADIGHGWIGTGWDRFPGISPPWNPVMPSHPAVPMPQPAYDPPTILLPQQAVPTGGWTVVPMPEPPPATTQWMFIADRWVPFTARW